jgi:hypothetical protein
MLRVLQTNAVSNKVAKLFETLTTTPDFQAQPLFVEVKRPSNDWPASNTAPLSAARRRRIRRRSLATSSGSIRTSWF